jgi:hypothetical protein
MHIIALVFVFFQQQESNSGNTRFCTVCVCIEQVTISSHHVAFAHSSRA